MFLSSCFYSKMSPVPTLPTYFNGIVNFFFKASFKHSSNFKSSLDKPFDKSRRTSYHITSLRSFTCFLPFLGGKSPLFFYPSLFSLLLIKVPFFSPKDPLGDLAVPFIIDITELVVKKY